MSFRHYFFASFYFLEIEYIYIKVCCNALLYGFRAFTLIEVCVIGLSLLLSKANIVLGQQQISTQKKPSRFVYCAYCSLSRYRVKSTAYEIYGTEHEHRNSFAQFMAPVILPTHHWVTYFLNNSF